MSRFGELLDQHEARLKLAPTPADVDLASWYCHFFAEAELLVQLLRAHEALEAALRKAVAERTELPAEAMTGYADASNAAWAEFTEREERRNESARARLVELGAGTVGA
jgi:cation transport regulator ChaB